MDLIKVEQKSKIWLEIETGNKTIESNVSKHFRRRGLSKAAAEPWL